MSLINEVKQEMLTLKGIAVTVVTNLIVVGFLSSWIFFRVNVMGDDVEINLPSAGVPVARKR